MAERRNQLRRHDRKRQDRILGKRAYAYDAWGNLTQKVVTKCSAENLSLSALANNQLTGYGYDAAGNMTQDLTSGLNYSYDQENRITGANGYTYTYDADGNRVKKSKGTTGTLYWYMTPGIVAESDLTGNLKSEYVFFNGERVARRDYGTPGGVFYYFSDHLKTASVITDSAGNIKSESDYYPWGGELQFTNNDSNHYKFTGKERDETGLDYFGARYYSNGLGRFISADWSMVPVAVPYADLLNPQSLNLYAYSLNNPATLPDFQGHEVIIQDPSLVPIISSMREEYPLFNTMLNLFSGPGAPNLIFSGFVTDLQVAGVKADGDETPSFGYQFSLLDPFDPQFVLKSATIVLDAGLSSGRLEDVLKHELGHAVDDFQNPRRAQNEQQNNTALPWSERPWEQRAEAYKRQIDADRKRREDELKKLLPKAPPPKKKKKKKHPAPQRGDAEGPAWSFGTSQ